MTDHDYADLGPTAQLVSIQVADTAEAWGAAGFAVAEGRVRLGTVVVELIGPQPDRQRGIVGWRLAGLAPPGHAEPTATLPRQIDGLPTDFVEHGSAPSAPADGPAHPNGATGIDHVVLSTPDLERTIAVLAVLGLQCRRVRETEAGGTPMRQAFFRLGPTVLEVVSGPEGSGTAAEDDPATFFGLAIDVEDLDDAVELLGEGLGRPKAAVQQGRRIATLRHRFFDVSVSVALMDDHAGR